MSGNRWLMYNVTLLAKDCSLYVNCLYCHLSILLIKSKLHSNCDDDKTLVALLSSNLENLSFAYMEDNISSISLFCIRELILVIYSMVCML